MNSRQVWELVGGRPVNEDRQTDHYSDRSGGILRGTVYISRVTEVFRVDGNPNAKIVLIYEGRGLDPSPPLSQKFFKTH